MTEAAANIEQLELPHPIGPVTPWRESWVPYDRAFEILSFLKDLLYRERSSRPMNVVLYGDTNNGKTMLATTFQQRMNQEEWERTGNTDKIPVVYVQTPPEGDVNTLLWLMLRALKAPTPANATTSRRRTQLLKILPQSGTRMLIFDEVHNFMSAPRSKQGLFLQELKFLSNELRIPIVCIGTVEVLRAIQTDQQNGNRFEPRSLTRWVFGDDFVTFTVELAKSMGINHHEIFSDDGFAQSLFDMSEGLTGEVRRIIAHAANTARADGKDKFEPYMFEQIDWVPPSERRVRADSDE